MSQQLQPWAWNLAIVAIAVALGFIIRLIITGILHFYKKTSDYSLFRSVITHISTPLNYFVPLLMINFMLPLLLLDKSIVIPIDRITDISMTIAFAGLLINSIKIFEDYVWSSI